MSNKKLFVTKKDDKWLSREANKEKPLGKFDTQKEAIQFTIKKAKETFAEVTIQGRDNKFREKNSYGNDPREIEG